MVSSKDFWHNLDERIWNNPRKNERRQYAPHFLHFYYICFFHITYFAVSRYSQLSALSMTGGDATKALPSYAAFMTDYEHAFRTFKHGALHGFLAGLFLILPSP